MSSAQASLADDPVPQPLSLRARVTALTPEQRVRIFWTWGGHGLGGEAVSGELTAVLPKKPTIDMAPAEEKTDVLDELEAGSKKKPAKQAGKVFDYLWLARDEWSPWVPAASIKGYFVTFSLMGQGEDAPAREGRVVIKDAVFEFEFGYGGKVIKRFSEAAPDHPTAGIVIPDRYVVKGVPTPEFVDRVCGLSQYAARRADDLGNVPWAQGPWPRLFAIQTDCYGYSESGGGRTGNRAVILTEFRTLRLMGANGLRAAADVLMQQIRSGEGLGKDFRRVHTGGASAGGYPVPIAWNPERITALDREMGRFPTPPPGAGCPYHPETLKRQAEWAAKLEASLPELRSYPVEECWLLTDDEIGSVYGRSPEGRDHQGSCPYCQQAFRDYLKSFGLGPPDFDATNWDELRSVYGYNAKPWSERVKDQADANQARAAALPKLDGEIENAVEQVAKPVRKGKAAAKDVNPEDADLSDEEAAKLEQKGVATGTEPAPAASHPLSERGWALLRYYSMRFNNDATARTFTPLREFYARQNELKRRALAEGHTDAPEARQPWLYSYALRMNSYLMGGGGLDFFDFYRYADNAFMYETSNRDPRVWEWDSYLCDVGRILTSKLNTRFGVCVKPHRGAVVQRALSAACRNARLIYWYTYGPDYVKGDSFAGNAAVLSNVSFAAHLLGRAEDVIYDATWARPAEVAVVRPRTSEAFDTTTGWENGKWVYAALMHAHIPVDPLDEELLLSGDLSRYKAIYVSGSNLRRNVAEKLARWVEAGGTLYTSGMGLARDEANQPLEALRPVLGLKGRGTPEMWNTVPAYGAVSLGGPRRIADVPAGMHVVGAGVWRGPCSLVIGREALDPDPGTEVLARFPDGSAALTCHAVGKGKAYVAGFYAGVEYATDVMKADYNMATDFSAAKRAFIVQPALLAGVKPVVDASHPLVEGVLMKHNATGKQAVVLMNWAYAGRGLVPQNDVTIQVRADMPAGAVTSVALDTALKPERTPEGFKVVLPSLQAGDVLLME